MTNFNYVTVYLLSSWKLDMIITLKYISFYLYYVNIFIYLYHIHIIFYVLFLFFYNIIVLCINIIMYKCTEIILRYHHEINTKSGFRNHTVHVMHVVQVSLSELKEWAIIAIAWENNTSQPMKYWFINHILIVLVVCLSVFLL